MPRRFWYEWQNRPQMRFLLLTLQPGCAIIIKQFGARRTTGCAARVMRGWRNWQTRTFEVRVGNLEGSNPFPRTKETKSEPFSCGRRVRIFGFIRKPESGYLSEETSPGTLPEIENSVGLIRSILTIKEKGCAPKDALNLKKAVYGWQGVPRRERPAFLLPTSGLALPATRQKLTGLPHC